MKYHFRLWHTGFLFLGIGAVILARVWFNGAGSLLTEENLKAAWPDGATEVTRTDFERVLGPPMSVEEVAGVDDANTMLTWAGLVDERGGPYRKLVNVW